MEALENGATDIRSCKEKYSAFDQVKVEMAVNKVKSPKCGSNDSEIDAK